MAKHKWQKGYIWVVFLYYLAAITLPNIFLFNVYGQNRAHAQISLNHVLFIAANLALISAVALLIMRLLTRHYGSSLVVNISFWLVFWFFESLIRILPTNQRPLVMAIVLLLLLVLAIAMRLLVEIIKKLQIIWLGTAGVIIVLFVINASPIIITAIMTNNVHQGQELNGIPIRSEFNIDTTLANPDIYWLHVDGLISLNSKERYFGIDVDQIRNQLLELGFVINEDAEFIAHNTIYGVPGLISPDFYDNYLHSLFMAGRDLLRHDRHIFLNDAFDNDGISLPNDVAPYHELFHAFLQAGYQTVMIADLDPDVYVPIGQFYRLFDYNLYRNNPTIDRELIFTVANENRDNHFLIDARDLIELLTLMTPLPTWFVNDIAEGDQEWATIPAYTERINELTADTLNLEHERQVLRALIDLHYQPRNQPTLTYITVMFGHGNRWFWLNDNEGNASNIELYPAAYTYTFDFVLKLVELITSNNPNAIIVLQADHGLHLYRTQSTLLAAGFTRDEVIHLHHSVFSAVLIPSAYGGLAAPLDPRNITRELVNRFVGTNYQLRND